MVRRTHHCRRCGSPIHPGDVYAALDVLDGEGRLRVLLCDSCATALRAFVEGDGDGEGDGTERPDAEPGSKPV